MNLHPDGMASREPQTASEKSESKLKYAYAQNTVLRTLDQKVLDKGLRTRWKFFSEDDVMFGSLSIRGGYVVHDMCTWRKDISSSSPKDILNLKQCLAEKALHFWEKNPDRAGIPGAKEEQAFVEAYENMVKIIQGMPAEEADRYSAYMEHRLRLAMSTDGGKTLGPLLHEVLSNKVSNPEMRTAATESQELKFHAAKALYPERYVNTDANDNMNVDYSREKKRKNSKEVTAKSLDGRSFALLVNNSLGKRKRLSGDEDDDDMKMEGTSNDRNVTTSIADNTAVHSELLKDQTFKSQSIPEENIAARAMRADTRSTIELPPLQEKKKIYGWMTPGKIENNTEIPDKVGTKTCIPSGTRISARTSGLGTTTFGTRTSGLRTSRLCTFDTGNFNTRSSKSRALHDPSKFEFSNSTTPLALPSNPNKRRKVTDESKR
ncbi:hypothetical protein BHYA_0045g00070 [Botrytis hyacinthi]|uniref:Uncharacterized protein n=1 Tax=Botrytis hyacinthi TaxID=278943 RepID=A0A4Z1GSR3_9HELO|nr:hypothetical protein BHYA_0045g00070 [Botrytis hyacinthi]